MVKGIVTWLAMRALSIERLPWMGDWQYTHVHDTEKLSYALKYMFDHPAKVDEACDELKQIYAHTQNHFTAKGQLQIELGRGFKNGEYNSQKCDSYATLLLRQADAARQLGMTHIDVPHDVITSWGFGCDYTHCVAGVTLTHPVTDILVSSDVLQPRETAIGHNAMESGEWLVLNRNLNGMMSLPVGSIQALSGFTVNIVKSHEAQKVFDEGIPALRGAAHFHASKPWGPKTIQPISSRAKRAWQIFWTKHQ